MRDPVTVTPSPRAGPVAPSAWSGRLPSLFVLIALAALLLVPMLVQSRVERLRDQVEALGEPVQDRLFRVQYLLSRQISALQLYLISGNPAHMDDFRGFADQETALYPELVALAGDLSPLELESVVELRTLSDEWHQRVLQEFGDPRVISPDTFERLVEHDTFLRMLDSAARAEQGVRAATLERREEIRTVESVARGVYVLLILLAMGAAAAIAMLNTKIAGLAAEADARRRDVEWALEETARAVEARAYLIRGFTHDVKNPLGAALGYAELMVLGLRGDLTSTQSQTIGRIQASIHGALEIIDELLDLSRLEGAGLRLSREAVDLNPLVREIVKQHGASAESAGLDLVFEGSGTATVYTDPDRVRQILGNLISNAVKYTKAPGSIRVSLGEGNQATPPYPGRWMVVAVDDTGNGIPQEEQERIFDEFHRVPGAPGGGHGLGLAIGRRIARLLGGDVTIRSTLGSGASFYLWLPLRDGTDRDGLNGD